MELDIYQLLNKEIEEFLKINFYDISHYEITGDLAKLIIGLGIDKPLYHDIEELDVSEIDDVLEGFFKSLSPELFDNYLNIRKDESIKYISQRDNLERKDFVEENYELLSEEVREKYKSDSKRTKSFLDKDGNLNNVLRGTVDDLFVIAHELMHKIFYQKVGNSDTFDNINFLVEVVSTTIEVMLADYLVEHDLYKMSALKHKYNTFKIFESMVYQYLLELALIRIYVENGKVTKDNLVDYIKDLDEPYKSKFAEEVDKTIALVASDGFDIWYFNRYIVAVFVSYYLKGKFREDANLSFKLGTDIYGDNLIKALKNSEIDFIRITNVVSRLLGNDKYKKNQAKIDEIYDAMRIDYQVCLEALDSLEIKR